MSGILDLIKSKLKGSAAMPVGGESKHPAHGPDAHKHMQGGCCGGHHHGHEHAEEDDMTTPGKGGCG